MGVDGGGGYRYGCAPDLSKDKVAICDPGGGGLVLPSWPDENTVSMPARAVLYFVGLSWCFIGLSLVADIFMGAIEAITQRRKWNDTVANLTLMALGRSAPQILLSGIEIAGAGFYAGDLGPSTIVGSAAFNLLVTLAICMYVIPDGETRTIKRPAVFVVTAVGSVFANLWLVIVVGVSTPSLIEPWEGVCTFLFFPILVVLAYLADKGKTKECTANKGAAGNGAGVQVSISDKEAAGNGAGAGKLQLADNAVNFGVMTEGLAKWKSKFQAAICPVPPKEGPAFSAQDWCLHFVGLPWKLLFALIPPVAYGGGWVCFCTALLFIGGLTAIIGDLASLMGCCMGLPDSVTAITIVAMGTSLPNAFASKGAAVKDSCADNAIGNVTGSNAVNVFLGLGLPWMIAAFVWDGSPPPAKWQRMYPELYKAYPDGGFVVLAGDLVFSVLVFTMCALIALSVIYYRRMASSAELGGWPFQKTNSAILFVMLWALYVIIASWKVIVGDFEMLWYLMLVLSCPLLCPVLAWCLSMVLSHRDDEDIIAARRERA